jgi:hypothetical protein
VWGMPTFPTTEIPRRCATIIDPSLPGGSPLIHAIVELADVGGVICVTSLMRILALMMSFSLLSCGTPEKRAAPASKTAAPADQPQPQKDQHRAACLPQAGGGIICQ